jgi:hypothetical protein
MIIFLILNYLDLDNFLQMCIKRITPIQYYCGCNDTNMEEFEPCDTPEDCELCDGIVIEYDDTAKIPYECDRCLDSACASGGKKRLMREEIGDSKNKESRKIKNLPKRIKVGK